MPIERDTMFRQPTLVMVAAISAAISAAVSLGLAVPAPVLAADLDGSHDSYRRVWGPRFYNGVPVSFGYGLCYQRELLPTPWGPRWRLVNHCQ